MCEMVQKAPMRSRAMDFARMRIAKERNPIKLSKASNSIGPVPAGKTMKSGRPRGAHSVISVA